VVVGACVVSGGAVVVGAEVIGAGVVSASESDEMHPALSEVKSSMHSRSILLSFMDLSLLSLKIKTYLLICH
jgi:adenine deaminase